MIACACKCLNSPARLFGLIIAVSVLALAAALTGQFAFGLLPCILCLYQRIPFTVAIGLGLVGLVLRQSNKATGLILGLCALTFLVNAGIAAYHSGVERGWWESAVEGCHIPDVDAANTADWIAKIMTIPSVPCSQIQWQDPVLGLTMANYNVLLNLAMFILCALGLAIRQCPSSKESRKPQE